jgi:hypothetical protein
VQALNSLQYNQFTCLLKINNHPTPKDTTKEALSLSVSKSTTVPVMAQTKTAKGRGETRTPDHSHPKGVSYP